MAHSLFTHNDPNTGFNYYILVAKMIIDMYILALQKLMWYDFRISELNPFPQIFLGLDILTF